jgi:two-component system, cell cycle sensor histidine kinase and response regulator CckA
MGIPLRVLFVEDAPDDAELLLRELERGGYEVAWRRVDCGGSMQNALIREIWDLVVCDYSMPHFSGLDALHILRATGLDIPLIFVSSTIGEDTAVVALKQGAHDYVMKGNLKRLLPAIQRELAEAVLRKERAQLEKRVRHLEKFEAIGESVGGIAHDFNNLIGVILGSAQLGEEQAPERSTFRERFHTIRTHAELAGSLTKQLLAFARRQVLQPKKVDLNQSVSRVSGVLRSGLRNIDLENRLDPAVSAIEADPTQIEQVLMNLILNARDAMPEGGRLIVETGNADLDEEFCRAHSYGRPGSFALLTISDTGMGMDDATQEHIFEPFFTTKEMGKGTGLGLATVYGIVKQHGGFINVYSELGRGTTFRIYWPAVPGRVESRVENVRTQSTVGTGTILIAEDNTALRLLAEEVLKSQGYAVIVANNGTEAVRAFLENPKRITLAFLDVVMPNMGGPEACAQMRSIRPDLPIVFASGHAGERASLNSNLPDGVTFVQKPYAPQALVELIRKMLELRPPT